MFSSLIAANVTGTYAFTFLPLPLPTQLINTLLPANSFALLSPSELAEHGLVLPSAGEGNSWVVIQAGQQIDTGMSLPGGRSTFQVRHECARRLHASIADKCSSRPTPEQEAKLEIPFLRSTTPTPSSSTPSPLTYKHTLLFSSSLMALSSSNLTGLRSHKTEFTTEGENGETYEARGYLSLFADDESEGGGGAGPAEWDEELVRACAGGWWVGERTGGVATRVSSAALLSFLSSM